MAVDKESSQTPQLSTDAIGTGYDLSSLKKWLKLHHASGSVEDYSEKPGRQSKSYPFVLTSVPLSRLRFYNHAFNPRTPNAGKVNELRASVSQLGLLSPLTCAYVDPSKVPDSDAHPVEPVVLLDGRHRFKALVDLRSQDKEWGRRAKVDLKIYYGLERSDLFLLSTYLNKTRKALARGEYYKVLVKVFEERKRELEQSDGRPRTEIEVFKDIRSPSITNLNFDMSVGRIVGITAFDDEEDRSWFPMVGTRQQERFDPPKKGLRPLTAGNLAVFLGYLCKTSPYKDRGEMRATEIANVLRLGEKFRGRILAPVIDYETATATSVCCKHWCLDAFGSILEDSKLFHAQVSRKLSPLSDPDPNWTTIDGVLRAYYDIMEEQAGETNRWKRGALQSPPWSYQTQRDQVKVPLYKAIIAQAPMLERVAK
ncbi:MAG TPA: hypothetical protein VFG07_01555 [Thermoplasmata archaeon]|nr:hypothetical protein [Thermoplasmata archaeon]